MTAEASENVVVVEAVKKVEEFAVADGKGKGKESESEPANAAPECEGVSEDRDAGETKDDAEAYVFVNGASDDLDVDPATSPKSVEDLGAVDPAAGEDVVEPEKAVDDEVLCEGGKEVAASAEVEADQGSQIVVLEVVEPEESSVSDDVPKDESSLETGTESEDESSLETGTESEVKSSVPVLINGNLELDDTNGKSETVITHSEEDETESNNLANGKIEAESANESTKEQGLECKELGDAKLDEIVSQESNESEIEEPCDTKLEAEVVNGSPEDHALVITENGDSKLEAEISYGSFGDEEEFSKLGEDHGDVAGTSLDNAVVSNSDECVKPEVIEMAAEQLNGAVEKDVSVEVQELVNGSYETKSLVAASPIQDLSSEIESGTRVVLEDEVNDELNEVARSSSINSSYTKSEIEVVNGFVEMSGQPEVVTEVTRDGESVHEDPVASTDFVDNKSSPVHTFEIAETNHDGSSCLPLCPEDESKPGGAVNNGSVDNVEGLSTHTLDVIDSQSEEGSKDNDEFALAVAPADCSLENSRSLPINSSEKIELECEQGNKSPVADIVGSVAAVDVRKETVDSGEDGSTADVDGVKLESDASTISFVENEERSSNKGDDEKTGFEEVEDKHAVSSSVGEPKKKTPIFILKMPRYIDDELRERIRLAEVEVNQKTQDRDAVRVEVQKQKAICSEYKEKVAAAKVEENAARDAFGAKRRDLESVQAMMNKLKNATSIEDIDERVCGMEHKIQHETMALRDEKQLIREIKQMKQAREQLYASMGSQSEFQEVFEQKENIEARMKSIKTELDSLRGEMFRAEDACKAAKRKYNEQCDALRKLQSQHQDVDSLRQQAYAELKRLKKDMYEKSKHFYQYRDDQKVAANLQSAGDSKALLRFHDDQMERVGNLYAKDDQFRRDYVKHNMVSTIRRLKTLDGTALGPDEEPQALPPPRGIVERTDASSRVTPPVVVNTESTSPLSDAPVTPEKNERKAIGALVPKDLPAKMKKASNSASTGIDPAAVPSRIEEAEEEPKERKLSKEEEELKRKEVERARIEEERQREEAAVKLKEQRRLEEIAKAKEAEERKKRNAEKAQARAEFKAKKEAELKEREKEKKARKQERKRGMQGDVLGGSNETESSEVPQQNSAAPEPAQELEVKVKPVTAMRRYSKSAAVKKVAPPPLPLRNRSKKRFLAWMWWALLALVLVTVVLVATNTFFGFGRSKFGF